MRCIFLHGNATLRWSYGWAPWLKRELEKRGFETVFETLPDSIIARKRYWLAFLKDEIAAGRDDILIGHSSGAVAAMRYCEENEVAGCALIAPCYTDLGNDLEKASGWYEEPWQWERIRDHSKFLGLFYATDDPFIPQEEFMHIAQQLSPEVFPLEERGHLMQETFPELLAYLLTKVS